MTVLKETIEEMSARPGFCLTEGGALLSVEAAREKGYHVVEPAAKVDPQEAYRAAVMALPEAKTRPRAAARIADLHNERSMPIGRVSTFMRSLPEELIDAETGAPVPKAAPIDERQLRRRCELKLAGLAASSARMSEEYKQISFALSSAERLNLRISRMLTSMGVDPAKV